MSSNSLSSVQTLTHDEQSARLTWVPPRVVSLNLLPTLGRPVRMFSGRCDTTSTALLAKQSLTR